MQTDPPAASGSLGAAEQQPSPGQSRQRSLLDRLTDTGSVSSSEKDDRLRRFLRALTVRDALEIWFGTSVEDDDGETICRRLNRAIASIDRLLNDQLNEILHHPSFQKLEASWRSLAYLVDQADQNANPLLEVRVLDVSWKELERDLERAVDFDRSQLFQKIYTDEYDLAGGNPYGMLIGDYEIHPWPSDDHPHNDVATLDKIAGVAASAFCPFIAGADPTIFGIDDFSQLETVQDIAAGFQEKGFIRWRSFRDVEDSRFVGLAMPRVLMRLPYGPDGGRRDGFIFREDVSGPDRNKYLWGNAACAFGEVVMRAFANTGWLAEIRGVRTDADWGGLVTGLPVHSFGTDKTGVATKSSTEIMISEAHERELGRLGFIPLIPCHDTEFSAFYGNQSAQKPVKYDRPEITQNAQLSAMLQYTLCVSRFAHYLKIIARNKVGSFSEPDGLQRFLHDWVHQYVVDDDEASPQVKARRPLREAQIDVRPDPNQPGHFRCIFRLRPHYQLDNLTAAISLRTRVGPPSA